MFTRKKEENSPSLLFVKAANTPMSAVHKVALVTGASGGIGRAAALCFSAAGYRTVVADVKEEGGLATVNMITERHGEAFFIKADVSREHDVSSMIQSIQEKYGRLDAAYNNAGVVGDIGLVQDCTLDNWRYTLDTNLTGVFLCCKYEVPLMLQNGGGSIVNCSSVVGKVGMPGQAAYSASKHGILGLTKALALEVAQQGIRVNAVCPGIIQTPMLEHAINSFDASLDDLIQAKQPIGRAGRSEEVAEAVVWLCCDAASLVTGSSMDVDGGFGAQ